MFFHRLKFEQGYNDQRNMMVRGLIREARKAISNDSKQTALYLLSLAADIMERKPCS